MIKQDTSENQARSIYLGIGSNLGNKRINIERAKFQLIENNIRIIKASSYYESLSWPNPKNPKFLNIVLEVSSNLKPLELIRICKKIEIFLGRKKGPLNSPRKCDIDILDFQGIKMNDEIILPHPRMQARNFVLIPLLEINKTWKHPISGKNLKTLILSLSNRDIRSIKQI